MFMVTVSKKTTKYPELEETIESTIKKKHTNKNPKQPKKGQKNLHSPRMQVLKHSLSAISVY